jgi:hypothetical protein
VYIRFKGHRFLDEKHYQPTSSDVSQEPSFSETKFNRIANGQKPLIYAALAYFVIVALVTTVSGQLGLLVIVPFVMALVGVVRVLIGLGSHVVIKIVYITIMFLPILNILALASGSARATKAMRKAGYKVGLLGAKKQR